MMNPHELSESLDAAAKLIETDPRQARQRAEQYLLEAEQGGFTALAARANYLMAQTYAMNAEFDTALSLIEIACAKYRAAGDTFEAQRTNLGRMHVLKELGRYAEALLISQEALTELGHTEQTKETQLLVAKFHQNRGVNLEQMGRYEQALADYSEAERVYATLGMSEDMADIQNNRGVALLALGRASEALTTFQSAAAIYAANDLPLLHALALINVGDAHLLLGEYTRGLAVLEQARAMFDPHEVSADKHVLLLDIADAYLALNLYPEALATYRELDDAFKATGMAHDRARALWSMGKALAALSQFDTAEAALSEAANLFARAGNLPMQSTVTVHRAQMLAARGDQDDALAMARAALNIVATNDWAMHKAEACLCLAELLPPNSAEAAFYLDAAEAFVQQLALPRLRYRLNYLLGHAKRLRGDLDNAEPLLLSAIADIEQLRVNLSVDRFRSAFLQDKLNAYDELILLYLGRDDIDRAFAMSERARSRALADMLTGLTRDAAQHDQTSDQAVAVTIQLQALQAELNTTYSELMQSADSSLDSQALVKLHARAAQLEQTINRLQLRQTATDTVADATYADTASRPGSILPPADATLLSFYVCNDEIIAFVHAPTSPNMRVVRRISSPSAIRQLLQQLAAQWARFGAGAAFVQRHTAQLEQSARGVLAALYDALMRPVRSLLDEAAASRLVILQHSLLHQVPFHALHDGESYVIDRFEISYAPSATIWALCEERQPPAHTRAAVFGVSDATIPWAEREAQAVASLMDNATVFAGEGATRAAFESAATDSSLIHVASHGLFRAGNPMFSSIKLHDGWLMATDVLNLRLNGAVVVLSACESARNQVIIGDEMIGLTRAFLGAGAMSLVASLWLAQDDTTARLMTTFYEQLQTGVGYAAALRNAQLRLKAEAAHPYYWAPFILTGHR